ncbi:hypothetical protein DYB37_006132 [Aphanomyces astaci]|uniref:Uncharacterized protein n=1 Tax=Aphanomyces astaci TaxID=112090 RepID=A0A3R7BEH3_APHAT|nr:hypothetical protein DYB35_004842 [Aphanomyces astaci]RHZ26184.1 hypothetical protein DYB37_006132 [Aphanomyces astaci]
MAKVASEHSLAAHMDNHSSLGSTVNSSSGSSRRDIAGFSGDDPDKQPAGDNDNEEEEAEEYADSTATALPRVGPPLDAPTTHLHPNRLDGLRKQSSYKNENPWNRPRTGKKLSFVDEKDAAVPLHEITYSKFTHYSRTAQAAAGAAPPAAGCCSIQ